MEFEIFSRILCEIDSNQIWLTMRCEFSTEQRTQQTARVLTQTFVQHNYRARLFLLFHVLSFSRVFDTRVVEKISRSRLPMYSQYSCICVSPPLLHLRGMCFNAHVYRETESNALKISLRLRFGRIKYVQNHLRTLFNLGTKRRNNFYLFLVFGFVAVCKCVLKCFPQSSVFHLLRLMPYCKFASHASQHTYRKQEI